MFTLIFIFFLKSDSSSGRMLIYKISLWMWQDHWLKGIGFDGFKTYYMHYQADYFSQASYSEKELLLADNTYFAFNEYLQFVIEVGIAGLMIIALYGYFFYRLIYKIINQNRSLIFFNALIGVLIAIHFAALFTYCFHNVYVSSTYVAIILTLLCRLLIGEDKNYYKTLSLFFIFLLLGFVGINYHFRYNKFLAIRLLERVRQEESIGELNKAYGLLIKIAPEIEDKADFWELKSRLEFTMWKLDEAQLSVLQLITLRPSNGAYSRLGSIQKGKGNIHFAELSYLTAIDMVPNRFIERYRLYLIYKEIGEKKKAKKIREDILNLPVKIPSALIRDIKMNLNLN